MTGHPKQKLFILGIDGVPLSLAEKAMERGRMPNFQRLLNQGSLVSLNSVYPVVSSVAWTTFLTGQNPAQHGIFGFVDRDQDLNLEILTSRHIQTKTIWQILSDASKRIISINVPGTYPPHEINGIMIGDFLCPSLDRVAHPRTITPLLNEIGYIIDPDPKLAHRNRVAFMDELKNALRARKELTMKLLDAESWDVFMLHIMETDRLHHFYWDAYLDESNEFHEDFWNIYRAIDDFIGELSEVLDLQTTGLMILSDHGFCGVEAEVDLNRLLVESGFASFSEESPSLLQLEPHSRAFSLSPGRIYLNLKGREPKGSVEPEEAPQVLNELRDLLTKFKDPDSGREVIEHCFMKEEIYSGPLLSRAADMIVHPHNGYDLKASLDGRGQLFSRGAISGMHTYENAMLFVSESIAVNPTPSLMDLAPTIFELLGVGLAKTFQGQSLLR